MLLASTMNLPSRVTIVCSDANMASALSDLLGAAGVSWLAVSGVADVVNLLGRTSVVLVVDDPSDANMDAARARLRAVVGVCVRPIVLVSDRDDLTMDARRLGAQVLSRHASREKVLEALSSCESSPAPSNEELPFTD